MQKYKIKNIINNYVKKKKLYKIIIIIVFQILLYTYDFNHQNLKRIENTFLEPNKYEQDNVTLVSAFYLMKSKHSVYTYIEWLYNLLQLNKSIVFFTEKAFMKVAKYIRPQNLYNKTVFIELEMKDFYSYINYGKLFENSFKIDREKRRHTVPLYLIWAEKCAFLRKVIKNNYFNSKCFYWIDSGWFRKNYEMKKYINNWPSPNKCYEDNRVLINLIRKFSEHDIKGILNFNKKAHKKLQRYTNVAGGMFGGQPEKLLKFIELYYKYLTLFADHQLFVGKDQNIFTYISFSHPDIVNLIYSKGNYFFYKKYLS